MKYLDGFLPHKFYHVYNHAVGTELLFRDRQNYIYFLQKYAHYITPVAKTFSYCLMPNHFHFFIQFRTEDEVYLLARERNTELAIDMADFDFHKFLMQQFSNCLNSFAKSINKRYGRRGALFLDYTKRVLVANPVYFKNLVYYIHLNPVKHGFCEYPSDWEFSSYPSLLEYHKSSKLERNHLLEWFDDRSEFISYHAQTNNYIPEEIIIEF
jgi:putative transposase